MSLTSLLLQAMLIPVPSNKPTATALNTRDPLHAHKHAPALSYKLLKTTKQLQMNETCGNDKPHLSCMNACSYRKPLNEHHKKGEGPVVQGSRPRLIGTHNSYNTR